MSKMFYIFLFLFVGLNACTASQYNKTTQSMIQSYTNTPLLQMPEKSILVLGEQDAPIRIDIFFDPMCYWCHVFQMQVKNFLNSSNKLKNNVVFYFHMIPLMPTKEHQEAMSIYFMMSERSHDFQLFFFHVAEKNPEHITDLLNIAEKDIKSPVVLSNLDKKYKSQYNEAVSLKDQYKVNYSPCIYVNGHSIGMVDPDENDLIEFFTFLDQKK